MLRLPCSFNFDHYVDGGRHILGYIADGSEIVHEVKMKTPALVLILLVALFTSGILFTRANAQSDARNPEQHAHEPNWDVLARRSADDCKSARTVILDALYAGQLEKLALAYERVYNAKPSSDIRLANYAHAAMLSERYRDVFQDETYKPCFDRALAVLSQAIQPQVERLKRLHDSRVVQHKMNETEYYKPVRKEIQVADAWLAWSIYQSSMASPDAFTAFNKTLALDKNTPEVYVYKTNMLIAPYNPTYFKENKTKGYHLLDLAESMEPKLHPLVLRIRAFMRVQEGNTRSNYRQARQMFQEYLNLWPNCPSAGAVKHSIAQLDKALESKNFN